MLPEVRVDPIDRVFHLAQRVLLVPMIPLVLQVRETLDYRLILILQRVLVVPMVLRDPLIPVVRVLLGYLMVLLVQLVLLVLVVLDHLDHQIAPLLLLDQLVQLVLDLQADLEDHLVPRDQPDQKIQGYPLSLLVRLVLVIPQTLMLPVLQKVLSLLVVLKDPLVRLVLLVQEIHLILDLLVPPQILALQVLQDLPADQTLPQIQAVLMVL